jgi:hypothetical protein
MRRCLLSQVLLAEDFAAGTDCSAEIESLGAFHSPVNFSLAFLCLGQWQRFLLGSNEENVLKK